MEEVKNPVLEIRNDLGMNREDLSQLANLSYSAVYNIERGNAKTISKKLLQALEDLGYDSEKIAKDYAVYKKKLSQQLKNKYAQAK